MCRVIVSRSVLLTPSFYAIPRKRALHNQLFTKQRRLYRNIPFIVLAGVSPFLQHYFDAERSSALKCQDLTSADILSCPTNCHITRTPVKRQSPPLLDALSIPRAASYSSSKNIQGTLNNLKKILENDATSNQPTTYNASRILHRTSPVEAKPSRGAIRNTALTPRDPQEQAKKVQRPLLPRCSQLRP